MPVYESIKNADNFVKLPDELSACVVFGWADSVKKLADECKNGNKVLALDGWYGAQFTHIANAVKDELCKAGVEVVMMDTAEMFISRANIVEYNKKYVTSDPGFGYVNDTGSLLDVMSKEKIEAARDRVTSTKDSVVIVYGVGACVEGLCDIADIKCYIDNTHQKVQWDMWEGKLVPFGCSEPAADYNWKEYHYSDFYILFRQKKAMYDMMDYYIENYETDDLAVVPRKAYDEMLRQAVTKPIKQVKIFSPGPWGAYRFLDMDYGVEGLSNNAWNKIGGPELRVRINIGVGRSINMPTINLLQYNKEVTGDYVSQKYPDLFPLDIWLDDGYHPTPQPAERISMPLHIHPSSRYVKEHFNEPLGRYETYYIVEAYEGANTWMGFKEHADYDAWENKCVESDNITPIEDWKDYICKWDSREGDLYLIPPGTMHGHGGNQMVLEMDTNPSINGTEYSFFEYDFARNSWDDNAKSMTGSQLKMHLKHSFAEERKYRESYVKENLLSTPKVEKWEKEFYVDKYATLPNMPFEIERVHFRDIARFSTQGKYMQMLTLTVGSVITVRSKTNPELCVKGDKFQTLVVPAYFGDYEIINEENGRATVVIQYLKNA